jgi:hypothetical protein
MSKILIAEDNPVPRTTPRVTRDAWMEACDGEEALRSKGALK